MDKNKKIIIILAITLIVLIAGGIGFLIYHHNTSQSTNTATFRGGSGNFAQRFSGINSNFGFVTGTVDSVNGNNTIVNDSNSGGQTIVILSDTTRISKTVTASQSDVLTNGANVTIQGTRSDTTITATKITLPMKLTRPSGVTPSGTRFGNGGFRRGSFGGGGVGQSAQLANMFTGTVSNLSANSFTLSARNGTTYTVALSNTTTYYKQTTGILSDITSGETILAAGTKDQTGSIEATTVSIGNK